MRKPIIAIAALAMLPLGACASDNYGGGYGYDRPGNHRPDRGPGYGRPGGDRGPGYGRPGRRPIRDNDQIYRDRDGRYYCKRDDGTTGTIVGAIAGGVLGNVIAPGGSKTLGTILGGAGGALAGRAIDKNDINCE